MTDKSLQPILKWAGGKRWLLPELTKLWVAGGRLVEPFCGGLAVALGLSPERALLNDINPHLINLYVQVQHGLKTDISMVNDAACFYAHRQHFNQLARNSQQSPTTAALFYYLNRTGFNGLCRFNKSGEFNVPFGKYKTINYVTDFRGYQHLFEQWQFTAVDFEKMRIARDDFIYADPPYDVEFVSYSKEGFGWSDQVRLVEWLSAHSGPIVLSNQATERIIALYTKHGFTLRYLDAPRRISANGDRKPAREVLAVRGIAA